MTGRYIDGHFPNIPGHGSAIESRLDDVECSISGPKEDDEHCLESFARAGEQAVLIDDSFERAIEAILESYTYYGDKEGARSADVCCVNCLKSVVYTSEIRRPCVNLFQDWTECQH